MQNIPFVNPLQTDNGKKMSSLTKYKEKLKLIWWKKCLNLQRISSHLHTEV